jgi:hypothetical protein
MDDVARLRINPNMMNTLIFTAAPKEEISRLSRLPEEAFAFIRRILSGGCAC